MMPSNPDVRDNHGLLDACYKGFLRSVKQSLRDFSEYYLDLNQLMISANVEHMKPTTALILAAEQGHIKVVQFLLQKGSHIECQNSDGETALMRAVQSRKTPMVQYLLEQGANPNTRNANNYSTALFYAAMIGAPSYVKELIHYGANVNMQDINGDTPLVKGVEANCSFTVIALVQSGADIHAVNKAGKSPLTSCKSMHLRSILEQNQTKNDQNSSDDIKATGNKRPRSEESPPVTTPKVFSPSLASKPVLPNPFLIPTDESFSQTQSNVQHDLVRKIPAFSIAENVVNLDKNPWQQKWEEERNHRIQVEFQMQATNIELINILGKVQLLEMCIVNLQSQLQQQQLQQLQMQEMVINSDEKNKKNKN